LLDAPNPWKTHTYTDDHSSVSWLFRRKKNPKEKLLPKSLIDGKGKGKNNYYIYRIRIHPDTIWTGKKHPTHKEREREREREREWKTERKKSRNK
jgi:hypothetical protein